jgi:hypothetical protein
MERAGFVITVLAGFLTAFLLSWQQYQGPSADWVSGFLCVLWSLLMLARLAILTAPVEKAKGSSALAGKILRSLHMRQVERRAEILQQSFGNSFAIFLIFGFVFLGWQVFSAIYPANHYQMDGVLSSIQTFFAAGGASPVFLQAHIFDWGQGFLFLLCLSMMGFMLRSYVGEADFTRITLLVLSGYIAAGSIFFAGLPAEYDAQSLLSALVDKNGVLGVTLLSFALFIPVGFVWLGVQLQRRDWIVIVGGTVGAAGLVVGALYNLTPALIGFFVLCWMALFVAWGASERQLIEATS